jgi:hypothetical protein
LGYAKHQIKPTRLPLSAKFNVFRSGRFFRIAVPLWIPGRTPGHLYLSLCLLAGQLLLPDATERAVPRAIDEERQQLEYSGKKGCHTNKNLLVVTEKGQVPHG